jgi:hypothetical protein
MRESQFQTSSQTTVSLLCQFPIKLTTISAYFISKSDKCTNEEIEGWLNK